MNTKIRGRFPEKVLIFGTIRSGVRIRKMIHCSVQFPYQFLYLHLLRNIVIPRFGWAMVEERICTFTPVSEINVQIIGRSTGTGMESVLIVNFLSNPYPLRSRTRIFHIII